MYKKSHCHPKYTAIITLLSYRSPIEFITKISKDLCKEFEKGEFLLDEYTHNDNEDKRFLFFRIDNGKITEEAFKFVSVDEDTRTICDNILMENSDYLEGIGVDM